MHETETWKWSRSVVSDSSRPQGLQPTRLLLPWDFPGKSTGVGRHCLLRPYFLHWSYLNSGGRKGNQKEQENCFNKVHICVPVCFVVVLKYLSVSSVQFSRSVVSDSLRPHEPQHTRPPCPSPTSGVLPNPCPLSRWCHPAISSSVVPFSSCPQSFPASGSLQMSQLFVSGGQSIAVSASKSVLPMNTQDWSPLGWTGWISLQSKGLSRYEYVYSSVISLPEKVSKSPQGDIFCFLFRLNVHRLSCDV